MAPAQGAKRLQSVESVDDGTAPRVSLTEFAKAQPTRFGVGCWLCSIPERAEVEAAAKDGMGPAMIRRWLAEACGYGRIASANRVGNHLRMHVER